MSPILIEADMGSAPGPDGNLVLSITITDSIPIPFDLPLQALVGNKLTKSERIGDKVRYISFAKGLPSIGAVFRVVLPEECAEGLHYDSLYSGEEDQRAEHRLLNISQDQ